MWILLAILLFGQAELQATESIVQELQVIEKPKEYTMPELLRPLLQRAVELLKKEYEELPETVKHKIKTLKISVALGWPVGNRKTIIPAAVAKGYLDLESDVSKTMINRFIQFCKN